LVLNSYDNEEISLHVGTILRQCIRYKSLAKYILNHDSFSLFFTSRIFHADFGLSSDYIHTFKELLLSHKKVSSEYLEEHFSSFFSQYMKLLRCDNFIVKSQSLEILAHLLTAQKANAKIIIKFSKNVENLKMMMQLFLEENETVKVNAFTIFAIIVNNAADEWEDLFEILKKNSEKLIELLENLGLKDKEAVREKNKVISPIIENNI